jgi:hypothetical protein
MGVRDSFTHCPLYLQEKRHQYPLDRIFGGTQSQTGCSGKEKKSNHYPCQEQNHGHPACSLVSILTDVTQNPIKCCKLSKHILCNEISVQRNPF